MQIAQRDEYDVFISYRGASGRMSLFLALVGRWNVLPAFALLFTLYPFLAGMLHLIPTPCENGVPVALLGTTKFHKTKNLQNHKTI